MTVPSLIASSVTSIMLLQLAFRRFCLSSKSSECSTLHCVRFQTMKTTILDYSAPAFSDQVLPHSSRMVNIAGYKSHMFHNPITHSNSIYFVLYDNAGGSVIFRHNCFKRIVLLCPKDEPLLIQTHTHIHTDGLPVSNKSVRQCLLLMAHVWWEIAGLTTDVIICDNVNHWWLKTLFMGSDTYCLGYRWNLKTLFYPEISVLRGNHWRINDLI